MAEGITPQGEIRIKQEQNEDLPTLEGEGVRMVKVKEEEFSSEEDQVDNNSLLQEIEFVSCGKQEQADWEESTSESDGESNPPVAALPLSGSGRCRNTPAQVLECQHCGFSTTHRGILKEHKQVHSRSDNCLECEICSFSASDQKEFDAHLRKHWDRGKDGVRSDDTYTARLKSNVRTHLSVVRRGDKPSGRDRTFKKPKRTVPEEKRFKCDDCSFSTSRRNILTAHKNVHTGEGLYACDHCGWSTPMKGTLRTHMNRHVDSKWYKCPLCDYRTKWKYNLTVHAQTRHTAKRPFECDICGHSTRCKSYLKRHVVVHTNEKPYKCDMCDYAASRKEDLKRHSVSHAKGKKYECRLCDFVTFMKRTMTAHLNWHIDTG